MTSEIRVTAHRAPGVSVSHVMPAPVTALRTGVPVFLGFAEPLSGQASGQASGQSSQASGQLGSTFYSEPTPVRVWRQLEETYAPPSPGDMLGYAVRGFFENGGELCYVLPLDREQSGLEALRQGLAALAQREGFDLVCAPDVASFAASDMQSMQAAIIDHCDTMGDRFAILDTGRDVYYDRVRAQRLGLSGTNVALYYPWIRVENGPEATAGAVPPCGHIAGIYARSDRAHGVHKAPANEIIEGVTDLDVDVGDELQGQLNPLGVNCLRAFRGRGIRVWGARTLSEEPEWLYISVRRIFLTASRWLAYYTPEMVHEPNDRRLWARIRRTLTVYFDGLWQRGALQGASPAEAFYIKCDAETNPIEVREAGNVISEIGLAATRPNEFIVVRIVHGASGVTIYGPNQTRQGA